MGVGWDGVGRGGAVPARVRQDTEAAERQRRALQPRSVRRTRGGVGAGSEPVCNSAVGGGTQTPGLPIASCHRQGRPLPGGLAAARAVRLPSIAPTPDDPAAPAARRGARAHLAEHKLVAEGGGCVLGVPRAHVVQLPVVAPVVEEALEPAWGGEGPGPARSNRVKQGQRACCAMLAVCCWLPGAWGAHCCRAGASDPACRQWEPAGASSRVRSPL
jgi:hypothetical protein